MQKNILAQAIERSQHCQRNWDLSRPIPQDDIDLLILAATQCPSKQNVAFYKLHVITNRSVIEEIHKHTKGFGTVINNKYIIETNSQTLANLLFVYEYVNEFEINYQREQHTKEIIQRDRNMAVGVSSGYVNLTASLLGYFTGFCACFNPQEIKKILNSSGDILLMLGVGYQNTSLNSRRHHLNPNFIFPAKVKQQIVVNRIS